MGENDKFEKLKKELRDWFGKDNYTKAESNLSRQSDEELRKIKSLLLHTNKEHDKRIINFIDGVLRSRENERSKQDQTFRQETSKSIRRSTCIIAIATIFNVLITIANVVVTVLAR